MNWKVFLIIGVLIIFSCEDRSSRAKKEVKVTLEQQFSMDIAKFYKSLAEGDIENYLELLHTKVFDYTTKEQLLYSEKVIRENGIENRTVFRKIEKKSKEINYQNTKYYILYCDGSVEHQFSGQFSKYYPIRKDEYIAIYGEENVELDEPNKTIMVKNVSFVMIAILGDDDKDWKYLPYNLLEMHNGLLPSKIKGLIESGNPKKLFLD